MSIVKGRMEKHNSKIGRIGDIKMRYADKLIRKIFFLDVENINRQIKELYEKDDNKSMVKLIDESMDVLLMEIKFEFGWEFYTEKMRNQVKVAYLGKKKEGGIYFFINHFCERNNEKHIVFFAGDNKQSKRFDDKEDFFNWLKWEKGK